MFLPARHFLVAASLKRTPISSSLRSYAVRRRRRTLAPCASDASFAFVLLKPEDVNDGDTSFAGALNPFKSSRRGPPLYAVTAMDQSKIDIKAVQERTNECTAGQDKLISGCFTTVPEIQRSTSRTRFGANDKSKLAPGAIVVVNFDCKASGLWGLVGVDVADVTLDRYAHFNQGYGKVVNVNLDSAGQAQSVDVAFEGLWSDEYATSVNLHYPTENGFYACVHPSRIVAHANFRNILSDTVLKDLAWEFALVWPHIISLKDDLQFFDAETREQLFRAPRTIRDCVEGKVNIKVRGNDIPVLDPLQVLPKPFW